MRCAGIRYIGAGAIFVTTGYSPRDYRGQRPSDCKIFPVGETILHYHQEKTLVEFVLDEGGLEIILAESNSGRAGSSGAGIHPGVVSVVAAHTEKRFQLRAGKRRSR